MVTRRAQTPSTSSNPTIRLPFPCSGPSSPRSACGPTHMLFGRKGPWVAAVSTPLGCCDTTMNHQKATVAPRITALFDTPRLPIVSSSWLLVVGNRPRMVAASRGASFQFTRRLVAVRSKFCR
jgi:hypothetical protein